MIASRSFEHADANGASHACLRYHWTISASESQYDVPWGSPSGSAASVSLYLWIACTAPLETTGLIAAEVGLAGSLTVLGFLPRNGFTNLGTPSNLLLQPPSCVTAPPAVLVAEIVVHDPGPGGTLCLVPSGNQLMLGVDCPTPPTA